MVFKKCSEIKPPRIFTEVLYPKNKTSVRQVGSARSKRNSIRVVSMLRSSIPKRKVHKKINEQDKKSLYNWILQHPRVIQSRISNDCLKVSINSHYEHSWSKNCYCKCLSGKFIIAW